MFIPRDQAQQLAPWKCRLCLQGKADSAFCLTPTKLTGNEFYCYKIEALQFWLLHDLP